MQQLARQRPPFRCKARSPQVRTMAFSAQSPDLHRLSLGRENFAFTCTLALLGTALYPIPVRRLADSLPASFSRPLALAALQFTWVASTSFPEDLHLLVIAHAGHTQKGRPLVGGPPFCVWSARTLLACVDRGAIRWFLRAALPRQSRHRIRATQRPRRTYARANEFRSGRSFGTHPRHVPGQCRIAR